MQRNSSRLSLSILIAGVAWLILSTLTAAAHAQAGTPTNGTVPPALINPSMECDIGYVDGEGNDRVPIGWSAIQLDGNPRLHSTREQVYDDECNPSNARHVERLEFEDSLMIASQNIETPPTPGKPFDVAILQQTEVISGTDYSVSSWMVSLCGGSGTPSDCPEGVYMAKMLGLDPRGGADPLSNDVIWVENRDNFVEPDGVTRVGWVNLRNSVMAQSDTLTIFVRISSPFQWHGNHAFVDAIKVVRAPVAGFVDLPVEIPGAQLPVRWTGTQSPDVAAIPGGTHSLLIDIQTRPEGGEWRDVIAGAQLPDGEAVGQTDFTARCLNTTYEFRIRARAEQPPAEEAGEGAKPNHRFPGSWSAPTPVFFRGAPPPDAPDVQGPVRVFLPVVHANSDC